MDERRQFHRYLLHTEIELEDIASRDVGQALTKDISRGGVCITTEGAPLDQGAQYQLQFLLPFTDEAVTATGRVMWSRRDGGLFDNGLIFTAIDDRFLDKIEEYSIGSVEEKG